MVIEIVNPIIEDGFLLIPEADGLSRVPITESGIPIEFLPLALAAHGGWLPLDLLYGRECPENSGHYIGA